MIEDMNYYLDTRKLSRDGKGSLKLNLRKDGKRLLITTGIFIPPEKWDAARCRCKDARLNARLQDIFSNAEDYILRAKADGRFTGMTADELAAEIRTKVLSQEPRTNGNDTLAYHMRKYRDRQAKRGTWTIYDRTIRSLCAFDEGFETRRLKEITTDYLYRYEAWNRDRGVKVNSISILMRNIRTVIRDAIAEGVTTCNPFARYRIRQEETQKRSMTVEDVRDLMRLQVPPDQQKYKDYFMLMVYLIGINTVDLFTAKAEDLFDGRLHYRREKTGKLYSVKVEPEAMAIIDKYRGRDYLLEPMDGHGDFLSWRSQLNKRLKALGQVTGKRGKVISPGPFPFLSSYWARHTWATLAYQIGIPVDIIGQALGHSDRSHAVTFIYIRPDAAKVDEANRKVIDYIKSGAAV